MPLTRSWRGALAAPAAVLLALGGVMFAAAPASAATDDTAVAADFAITAESDGSADDLAPADAPLPTDPNTPVDPSAPVDPATPADPALPADPTTPADPADPSNPADPTPAAAIKVTSPTEGATVTSRTVTYTGTAPVGSTITASTDYPILGEEIELTLPVVVDAAGNFSLIVPFAPATENPVTVTFAGAQADGTALDPVVVSIDLPDPVAAPVITAPTSAAIVGPTVTFSGTGIPGNAILLTIVPTDEPSLNALATVDPLSLAAPIVVQPDGTWTGTYTLALGNFAVTATHVSNATTVADLEILSLPSAPVTFSLVAPIITTASSSSSHLLAETGPAQAGFLAPAALALLGVGAFLLVARRRSTSTN